MFKVFGFYKFKKLTSLKKNKVLLQDILIKRSIRGTIIIASEGVNATISGKATDLQSTITKIKKILDFKNLIVKIFQKVNSNHFINQKLRLKKK